AVGGGDLAGDLVAGVARLRYVGGGGRAGDRGRVAQPGVADRGGGEERGAAGQRGADVAGAGDRRPGGQLRRPCLRQRVVAPGGDLGHRTQPWHGYRGEAVGGGAV